LGREGLKKKRGLSIKVTRIDGGRAEGEYANEVKVGKGEIRESQRNRGPSNLKLKIH